MLSRFSSGLISPGGGVVRSAASLVVVVFFAGALGASAANEHDEDGIRRLIDLGHWPQAEAGARTLLVRVETEQGQTSPAAANVLDLLVTALILNKKDLEPRTCALAERAVELRSKLDGADSSATVESLLNQGKILKENSRLKAADAVLDHALAIQVAEFGPDHLEIARVHNAMGGVANRGRDTDTAEKHYGLALAMLESTVGGDHSEVAVSLTGLHAVMFLRHRYDDAVPFMVQALKINEQSLGPDHPWTAESLRLLGSLRRRLGENAQAEVSLRRSVEVFSARLGPEHPLTGQAFNSLALLVRGEGRFAEAQDFFEQALKAFETSHDPLDPRIAGVLNNLAAVHRELGDFADAETCLRRSLTIREGLYGADHPAIAQSLGNLASVLVESHRYAEAVPLLERAIAIKEGVYGPSSIEVAGTLGNHGRACRGTGDLDRAESSLEEAVDILSEKLGPVHPTLAGQLVNLALVEHDKRDFESAREDLLRAIEIRRSAGGETHYLIGRAYFNLARVEADAGNPDAAMEAALRAVTLGREQIQITARGLSEDEAIGFDQYTRNRLDLLLAFAKRWPRFTATAWDALIRSRGLVLNELVVRQRAARSDDPRVAALHDELTAAAERLARLSLRGAGDMTPQSYQKRLTDALSEVGRLERSLGRESAEFGRDQLRSRIGFQEVADAVPPGAALVGFFCRSIFSDPVGTRIPNTWDYVAAVLAPGSSAPRFVVLGPAQEIESLITQWRRAAVEPGIAVDDAAAGEMAYRRAGEALRRRLWDPLKPLVGDAATVFVVPDGDIGLVNLASLPTGVDGYLVETGPLIHMLDEERDLAEPPATGRDRPPVLLALGDPDFDWKRHGAETSRSDEADRQLRGTSGGCGSFDEVVFDRLPTTAPETRAISELWHRHNRRTVRLSGVDATEANFKRLAPGKTAIHLATHGFVFAGGCDVGPVQGRGVGGLASRPTASTSAANEALDLFGLSGLALAGANHRMDAMPTEEDGVITAAEIAYLDLTALEWAVLSACDTGVGESVSGEGVFGFRRAFRLAGARTVIMSLWPVEDDATQRWMELLYQARLGDEMSTAASVQHASLTVLRERRADGQSTHPFYWGAFVAAGDWR